MERDSAVCCDPTMPTERIYVKLRDEGVDVWRPVDAQPEGSDIYLLPAHAPDDEAWRFVPGSRVRCEWRELDHARVLVAVEQLV